MFQYYCCQSVAPAVVIPPDLVTSMSTWCHTAMMTLDGSKLWMNTTMEPSNIFKGMRIENDNIVFLLKFYCFTRQGKFTKLFSYPSVRAGVQYIIESVVKELAKDPDKKFIQVETGFFWRWWEDKNEYMRNLTQTLVDAGQLVFTGGGWSMNDEAVTHYTSIIDNMETGLNWLVDNLGECAVTNIAWQIDPFGHSKEQARLFAEMGFEGLFFARIDKADKEIRKRDKSLQMWWYGGEEDEDTSKIFTGVFDNHYSSPTGFNFDILAQDEPINDNPRLEEYNVDERLAEFEQFVLDHVKYYKDQEHIMFTMGDDFTYQNARQNYKNMDKLIKHMNEKSEETGIHLMYSTPACYLQVIIVSFFT